MGKMDFTLTIARNAALERVPVAIISLVTRKEHFIRELLCMEAKMKIEQIYNGPLSEVDWSILSKSVQKLSDLPIVTSDTAGCTVATIREQVRKIKADHDVGLIIIDHLQQMRSDGLHITREQEIADICRSLKELAVELNLVVIVLSEVSRKPEFRTNHHPRLSDIAEGDVASYAYVVLFVYRDYIYNRSEDDPEREIAEIIVEKNKNGATGSVKLFFDEEYHTFENFVDRFELTVG
jgi:replicative DNA helicase